jgi:hypothetical protein
VTGLPPARRPHPRSRPALLARAAAGPDRRDPHRHHLASRPRPVAAPARRHVHRLGRAVPPDQPAQHRGPPATHRPRPRPAPTDPAPRRRPARNALTRHNPAPSDTRSHQASTRLPSSDPTFGHFHQTTAAERRYAGPNISTTADCPPRSSWEAAGRRSLLRRTSEWPRAQLI